MSNYKEQLQQNNNELNAILETVNNLPEAGGGINFSIVTGTITGNANLYLQYTNENVDFISTSLYGQIKVIKNTIITFITDSLAAVTISGDASRIYSSGSSYTVIVNGDFSINLQNNNSGGAGGGFGGEAN